MEELMFCGHQKVVYNLRENEKEGREVIMR